MGSSVCKTYTPDAKAAEAYKALYQKYQGLGAYVDGGVN